MLKITKKKHKNRIFIFSIVESLFKFAESKGHPALCKQSNPARKTLHQIGKTFIT